MESTLSQACPVYHWVSGLHLHAFLAMFLLLGNSVALRATTLVVFQSASSSFLGMLDTHLTSHWRPITVSSSGQNFFQTFCYIYIWRQSCHSSLNRTFSLSFFFSLIDPLIFDYRQVSIKHRIIHVHAQHTVDLYLRLMHHKNFGNFHLTLLSFTPSLDHIQFKGNVTPCSC